MRKHLRAALSGTKSNSKGGFDNPGKHRIPLPTPLHHRQTHAHTHTHLISLALSLFLPRVRARGSNMIERDCGCPMYANSSAAVARARKLSGSNEATTTLVGSGRESRPSRHNTIKLVLLALLPQIPTYCHVVIIISATELRVHQILQRASAVTSLLRVSGRLHHSFAGRLTRHTAHVLTLYRRPARRAQPSHPERRHRQPVQHRRRRRRRQQQQQQQQQQSQRQRQRQQADPACERVQHHHRHFRFREERLSARPSSACP